MMNALVRRLARGEAFVLMHASLSTLEDASDRSPAPHPARHDAETEALACDSRDVRLHGRPLPAADDFPMPMTRLLPTDPDDGLLPTRRRAPHDGPA